MAALLNLNLTWIHHLVTPRVCLRRLGKADSGQSRAAARSNDAIMGRMLHLQQHGIGNLALRADVLMN